MRTRFRMFFRCRIGLDRCGQIARFLDDLRIVGVTGCVEERADLGVGQTIYEARLAHHRLAATSDDLLEKPFEILLHLGIGRQGVNGAFDCDRTDALQTSPDLHPEVGGLAWQLMDQEQPTLLL
ncbi:hypothetical protein NKI89_08220 [Mesorhizobium sp. M0309]